MAEPPLPLPPHSRLVSCPSTCPVCLSSSRPVCPGASLLFALCANLISSYYGAEILQFPQMPKTQAGLVSPASTASSVYLCPEMENTCKQPQTQFLLDEVFIGRVLSLILSCLILRCCASTANLSSQISTCLACQGVFKLQSSI